MPIREERLKLVDDSRTFSAEDLTEVWAWLDSCDSQPSRPGHGEKLVRPRLTFHQATYVHREKVYRIAKCSDGRELLGSILDTAPPARPAPKRMGMSLWSGVLKLRG